MKWRSFLVMGVILASLVPAYFINRLLQNLLRPRESASRLFIYLITAFILVFVYTFLLVVVIKLLFAGA